MICPPLSFPAPWENTQRYLNVDPTNIHPDETVLVAKNASEVRGQLPVWNEIRKQSPNRLIEIEVVGREFIRVLFDDKLQEIYLTDEATLSQLVSHSRILIDISGLPHHIWAPLLKSAYSGKVHTRVLYAEPASYKLHPNPASATTFDLSTALEGLAPLPGFVNLDGPNDKDKCIFVPLLGFEGNRPERLASQLDPLPKIVPIVGVPGFQLEFPAFTVASNHILLNDYKGFANIHFARASCPFEAVHELEQIQADYPEHYMYIAPVGTKPHSLGAILYSILNPSTTEIMFDHPVRKKGRTDGVGMIHIYDFGQFTNV